MSLAAPSLRFVRHSIIPHPENNHWPYALRHGPLAATSAVLLAAKLAAIAILALTPASADLATITSARIIQLTNQERQKAGLPPLATSSLLGSAATQKGNHLLEEDYFAHISPSGVTPWFWIQKVGYSYQIAGENLAVDFTEAEDVVAAWMASPTHRDNLLLPDYTEIGVGVVTGEFQGGTSTIVVQMFGLPPGSAAPAPAPAQETPKPTPSPSPSPTPPALPATSPALPPPRPPRIALQLKTQIVRGAIPLTVTGESGSQVQILANSQLRQAVTLPPAGTAAIELDLHDLPDGQITLRAQAQNTAGVSHLSSPLVVTKDTAGPVLPPNSLAFIIGPATDQTLIAYKLPPGDYVTPNPGRWQALTDWSQPFTVAVADEAGNTTTLADTSLAPQYATSAPAADLPTPARFSQLFRRLAIGLTLVIIMLLAAAILIRIRIQHPALIAHASLVALLAATLLFL